MNALHTIYCVGQTPKVELKGDVRLFRLKLTQQLPRWDCPKEGWLSLTLHFQQPWFYANQKLKKQDVPNLVKVVLDTLAARYRFDDSRIWSLTCEKVDSQEVGIHIELHILETHDIAV